ncbi:hypothetical protein Q4S26_21135, partial [Morganella morganii]
EVDKNCSVRRASCVRRKTGGDSGYVKKLSQVNGKFVNRCVDSSKNAPFSAVTMLCSHLSGG